MWENKKLLIGIGAGIFVLIIVIVLVVVLGGKNNPGNNGNTGSQIGPGNITMWTPIGDKAAYAPFIEGFQEKDLAFTIVEKDPATYEADLIDAIASGGGPDIFMVKNNWVAKHYAKIYPIPYQKTRYSDSTEIYKGMYPAVVATEMVGGKGDIFGYPLSSDPLVLYINKGITEELRQRLNRSEAGLDDATAELLRRSPATWDDLVRLSEMLTVKNGTQITQSGIAFGTENNIESAQDILSLIMLQNQTKFQSSDGKSATFHLQQKSQSGADWYPGTNALAFYTSFADPKSDVYSWNEGMPSAINYFIDGKLVMMINYASRAGYIRQMNPNLDFELAPLPQVRQSLNPNGFMSYWAMTVNKNSKSGNLAWSVISDLVKENNREKYLKASGRSPIFTADLGSTSANSIDGQILKAKPVYKPDAAKYNTILLKMIRDVVHSGQPTQLSIEDAARDVSALLKSGG